MGGEEAMSEEETNSLREKVCELRRTLPDPSARDISDAIEGMTWATANRVKKVNTKLNREVKEAGRERDAMEPDETDGPMVLEELGRWPSDASLYEHLANDRNTRIFKISEHHAAPPLEGGGGAAPASFAALGFRRSLAALAQFFDQKYTVYKVCDAEETSELVLVCGGVKWWQSDKKSGPVDEGQIRAVFELEFHQGAPRSGAHKRLVAGLLAKHAGNVGSHTATTEEQELMMTHLRRNRHYEDKYKKSGAGAGFSQSELGMLASYIVTPAPEWFR
jgi:hypothetical protein